MPVTNSKRSHGCDRRERGVTHVARAIRLAHPLATKDSLFQLFPLSENPFCGILLSHSGTHEYRSQNKRNESKRMLFLPAFLDCELHVPPVFSQELARIVRRPR